MEQMVMYLQQLQILEIREMKREFQAEIIYILDLQAVLGLELQLEAHTEVGVLLLFIYTFWRIRKNNQNYSTYKYSCI